MGQQGGACPDATASHPRQAAGLEEEDGGEPARCGRCALRTELNTIGLTLADLASIEAELAQRGLAQSLNYPAWLKTEVLKASYRRKRVKLPPLTIGCASLARAA